MRVLGRLLLQTRRKNRGVTQEEIAFEELQTRFEEGMVLSPLGSQPRKPCDSHNRHYFSLSELEQARLGWSGSGRPKGTTEIREPPTRHLLMERLSVALQRGPESAQGLFRLQ